MKKKKRRQKKDQIKRNDINISESRGLFYERPRINDIRESYSNPFLFYDVFGKKTKIKPKHEILRNRRPRESSRLQYFASPYAKVCVERRERREVLFRNSKVGKGIRSLDRNRKSKYSKIKCRRVR